MSDSILQRLLLEQRQRILELPKLLDNFHEPYFNNFSICLVNKRFQLQELKKFRGNSLKKLNVANANLYLFSLICWEDLDVEHRSNILNDALRNWEEKLRLSRHFLTYPDVEKFVQNIRNTDCSFDRLLVSKKYVGIKKAFLDIDEGFKSFFVFAIGIPLHETNRFLAEFLKIIECKPLLLNLVERIEILKNYVPSVEQKNNEHPQIKIFMDKHSKLDIGSSQVKEMRMLLKSITKDFSMIETKREYFHTILPGVTLGQGFSNYKRFLSLLGWIDEVYDKSTKHAFINRNC